MAKKLQLRTATNQQTLISTVNYNNQLIEDVLEMQLGRAQLNGADNSMFVDLDMNQRRIINLPDAVNAQEPITLSQLEQYILAGGGGGGVTDPLAIYDVLTAIGATGEPLIDSAALQQVFLKAIKSGNTKIEVTTEDKDIVITFVPETYSENTILGRQDGSGTGEAAELSPSTVRGMLNVEDGATNGAPPISMGQLTDVQSSPPNLPTQILVWDENTRTHVYRDINSFNTGGTPNAAVITAQPASQTVVPGAGVTFAVSATYATDYQWEYSATDNGTYIDILDEFNSFYSIESAQEAAEGAYRCRVTGDDGEDVYSEKAILTVQDIVVGNPVSTPGFYTVATDPRNSGGINPNPPSTWEASTEDVDQCADDFITGSVFRRAWSDMQLQSLQISDATKYDINTAAIDRMLNQLPQGKQMLLFIQMHYSYSGALNPVPTFCVSALNGRDNNEGDEGSCIDILDADTIEEFTRFGEAVAHHYDDDPRFEGVILQETALFNGNGQDGLAGLTTTQSAAVWTEVLRRWSRAFVNSNVVGFTNFLSGTGGSAPDKIWQMYLDVVADTTPLDGGDPGTRDATNLIFSGPDWIPGNYSLQPWNRAYGTAKRMHMDADLGDIPYAASFQNDTYRTIPWVDGYNIDNNGSTYWQTDNSPDIRDWADNAPYVYQDGEPRAFMKLTWALRQLFTTMPAVKYCFLNLTKSLGGNSGISSGQVWKVGYAGTPSDHASIVNGYPTLHSILEEKADQYTFMNDTYLGSDYAHRYDIDASAWVKKATSDSIVHMSSKYDSDNLDTVPAGGTNSRTIRSGVPTADEAHGIKVEFAQGYWDARDDACVQFYAQKGVSDFLKVTFKNQNASGGYITAKFDLTNGTISGGGSLNRVAIRRITVPLDGGVDTGDWFCIEASDDLSQGSDEGSSIQIDFLEPDNANIGTAETQWGFSNLGGSGRILADGEDIGYLNDITYFEELDAQALTFSLTEQPATQQVEEGSPATFNVESSAAGSSYQWFRRPLGTSSWTSVGTGDSYTTEDLGLSDDIQVYCVVTFPDGSTANSNTAAGVVNELDEITTDSWNPVYFDSNSVAATSEGTIAAPYKSLADFHNNTYEGGFGSTSKLWFRYRTGSEFTTVRNPASGEGYIRIPNTVPKTGGIRFGQYGAVSRGKPTFWGGRIVDSAIWQGYGTDAVNWRAWRTVPAGNNGGGNIHWYDASEDTWKPLNQFEWTGSASDVPQGSFSYNRTGGTILVWVHLPTGLDPKIHDVPIRISEQRNFLRVEDRYSDDPADQLQDIVMSGLKFQGYMRNAQNWEHYNGLLVEHCDYINCGGDWQNGGNYYVGGGIQCANNSHNGVWDYLYIDGSLDAGCSPQLYDVGNVYSGDIDGLEISNCTITRSGYAGIECSIWSENKGHLDNLHFHHNIISGNGQGWSGLHSIGKRNNNRSGIIVQRSNESLNGYETLLIENNEIANCQGAGVHIRNMNNQGTGIYVAKINRNEIYGCLVGVYVHHEHGVGSLGVRYNWLHNNDRPSEPGTGSHVTTDGRGWGIYHTQISDPGHNFNYESNTIMNHPEGGIHFKQGTQPANNPRARENVIYASPAVTGYGILNPYNSIENGVFGYSTPNEGTGGTTVDPVFSVGDGVTPTAAEYMGTGTLSGKIGLDDFNGNDYIAADLGAFRSTT